MAQQFRLVKYYNLPRFMDMSHPKIPAISPKSRQSVLDLQHFEGNGAELREKVGRELRLTPQRLRPELTWEKGGYWWVISWGYWAILGYNDQNNLINVIVLAKYHNDIYIYIIIYIRLYIYLYIYIYLSIIIMF